MIKMLKVTLVSAAVLIGLTACSGGSDDDTAPVQVTEENKEYLEEYDEKFQTHMKELTRILQGYNDAVDNLYTQKFTREQFAETLKAQINDSNALVTEIEKIDVDPSIFEAHQGFIALVNNSHQLLLVSIDAASNSKYNIDKLELRSRYMKVKNEQANMSNQWKLLRKELSKPDTTATK